MSTGRNVLKELYVGFLLFLLTFLYLSRLNHDVAQQDLSREEALKAKRIELMRNIVRG